MTQLRFEVTVSSFISRIIVFVYHLFVMKLIHALVVCAPGAVFLFSCW